MDQVDDNDVAGFFAQAVSAELGRRVLAVSVRGSSSGRWSCTDADPRGASIRRCVESGDLGALIGFDDQPCHLKCSELRSNGELIGVVEVIVDGPPDPTIDYDSITRSATAYLALEIRARMAERSLETERARISLLARHNVNPVAVMGSDGRLVWVTEALAHSVGRSVDELVGTYCLDLVDPEQRDAGRDLLTQLPSLGVVTTSIKLNVNGRQIAGVCRAEFDPETGGMVVIFVGHGDPDDSTGDRALRWMSRFGTLLDALGEGVALVDADGVVCYSNAHMTELSSGGQMIIDLTDRAQTSGTNATAGLGSQQLRVTDAAGRHHLIETVTEPVGLGQGDAGGGVIMIVRHLDRVSVEKPTRESTTAPANRPARPARHDVPAGFEDLSAREWDVLHLLLEGYRVPSIAKRLYLSQHTVRNHLKAIFRKTRVSSQAELIERLRS
ncbi:MAG: LuxR C-terminal-related transcriptional regulator [Acidimicrobiia bacterium]